MWWLAVELRAQGGLHPLGMSGIIVGICICGSLDQQTLSAADDAATNPVVAGATLTEWRERMSVLELRDPAGARFVPGLLELVRRSEVPWFTRRQAALTLGRMGQPAEAAVPVIMDLLRARDPPDDAETELWAIKALGLFGPLARDATPVLLGGYRRSKATELVRLSTIDALSQIGPAHPAAIPFLIQVAGENSPSSGPPDSTFRRAAIEALGIIGPSAAVAVPTLVRALDAEDENLRREAANSLGKMGPLAGVAVGPLIERLVVDESPAVQDAAATALAGVGAGEAGERLVDVLQSNDVALRQRVAQIYGRWESAASPWAPALEALWDDADAMVRLAALEASWRITRSATEIAPRMVAEFLHADRDVRRRAYVLFRRLGPAGRSAATDLERLAEHPRSDVRTAAKKASELCCDTPADQP